MATGSARAANDPAHPRRVIPDSSIQSTPGTCPDRHEVGTCGTGSARCWRVPTRPGETGNWTGSRLGASTGDRIRPAPLGCAQDGSLVTGHGAGAGMGRDRPVMAAGLDDGVHG